MRRLVILYFFLSGACGLIYEVVWTRYMGLAVGVTVHAITTVLVAFMGGLALGGYLGGRYIDRSSRDPLRVYGILEGVIGLYCLLIPLIIRAAEPLLGIFYRGLGEGSWSFIILRFSICTLILLIPTTMMGATLPVLVREKYRSRERFGWTTGQLYTINTLGAVLGSFLSGFVLIPRLGHWRTTLIAAAINFLIFAAAFLTSSGEKSAGGMIDTSTEKTGEARAWSAAALICLLGYAVSGEAAMIYQVAWTRALSLSLGSSIYAFSLILTAFIAGLALGGAAMSPVADRLRKGLFSAGLLEVALGLSALGAAYFMGRLPLWMVKWYGGSEQGYDKLQWIQFGVSFGLILVPTFIMGTLLPLLSRVYAQLRGGVGAAVGQLYAGNTVGAIIGSLAVGFILIGWLGIRNTILAASGMSAAVGVMFLLLSEAKAAVRWPVALVMTAISVLALVYLPPWDGRLTSFGPYIYSASLLQSLQKDQTLEDLIRNREERLFYREGTTDTVAVARLPDDDTLTLRVNGKVDASTGLDMTTQLLLGHLPMLLHQNPKRVMVLGLASGISLSAVTLYPVESVDCLEISETIVQAYQYFKPYNRDPLADKRVHLIIADGRNHWALSDRTYDVIISEPSNPWIAGQGLVFTRESFAAARSRLNPGGLMVSWIGAYDMDLDTLKMYIRTFAETFPQSMFWEAIPGDYMMIGVNGEINIDGDEFVRKCEMPRVAQDLNRVSLSDAEILGQFIMGPKNIIAAAGAGPIHTDDRRQLEFMMPRSLTNDAGSRLFKHYQFLINGWEPVIPYLHFSDEKKKERLEPEARKKMLGKQTFYRALALSSNPEADQKALLQLLLETYSLSQTNYIKVALANSLESRAAALISHGQIEPGLQNIEMVVKLDIGKDFLRDLIASFLMEQKDFDPASKWLEEAIKADPHDARARLFQGLIFMERGQNDQAENTLQQALQVLPEFKKNEARSGRKLFPNQYTSLNVEAAILYNLGRLAYAQGDSGKAGKFIKKALDADPQNREARTLLDKLKEQSP